MVARDEKLSSAFLILLKIHILIMRFKVSETNRDSNNVFENRRPRKSHRKDKNEETRERKVFFKTYKTDKNRVGATGRYNILNGRGREMCNGKVNRKR